LLSYQFMYIMKIQEGRTCERRSESTNGEPCDMGIPSENKNKGCGGCYCDVCLPLALLPSTRVGLLGQRTIKWSRGIDLVSLV
jgi:hypothetical protein